MILLALIIALGVGIRIWAAAQWSGNFDSDEAIFGLMARHINEGELPVYYYGQHYMGSVEAFLAAGMIKLFGSGVFPLRLGSVLLFGIFLLLHAKLVRKLWGNRAAIISLLVLAIPGWWILNWTYRPVVNYGTLLLLGTLTLLFTQTHSKIQKVWSWKLLALGFTCGLGIWTHPMFTFYLVPIGIVFILGSPEWEYLSAKLGNRRHAVRWFILPGAMCLIVLALFSNGWEPTKLFQPLKLLSFTLLAVTTAAFALLFWRVSHRRSDLLRSAMFLAMGFILGNFPQWGGWLLGGIRPGVLSNPSTPGGIITNLGLLTQQMYPSLWGLPPLVRLSGFNPAIDALWQRPFWQLVLWGLASNLITWAVVVYHWKGRKSTSSMITLSPLQKEDQSSLLLILLFAFPLLACLFSGNTDSIWSVRYLIITWQAGSIMLALFLTRLYDRSKQIAWIGVLVCVLLPGLYNTLDIRSRWRAFPLYDAQVVEQLENYLSQKDIRGGYADYWFVYALDYLTEERFNLTPYNGIARVPSYENTTDTTSIQAFILNQMVSEKTVSDTACTLEELARGLTKASWANRDVVNRVEKASLQERKMVGNWYVWLTEKKR
jgi:hypothetical protein